MAEVQAVKDLDKVKLISHLLERRYSKQMADVWNIGLNLALRISDLCKQWDGLILISDVLLYIELKTLYLKRFD